MTEQALTVDDDAAALLARMARKELYIISNRSLVPAGDLHSLLKQHLLYMIDLERAGTLFASGPVFDETGAMTGDGVTIVRAASFADAQRIADEDPFVKSALRTPSVRRWVVNEGRLTISVDLSSGTGACL